MFNTAIFTWCREATLSAVRAATSDTELEISAEMLKRAKVLVKPSVGDRRKFQEWNEKFGSY